MSFQREYAEPYEWVAQQFKDWAFTLSTSILYDNDYDLIDEDTIVSGIITIAIFGGDLCRYAVKSKSAKYAGFAVGFPALIVILFSTITTSMMDIYTISNSLTNLFERWDYKKAVLIVGIAAVLTCWLPVVAADFTTYFYSFIGIVGAVFPRC